MEGGGIDIIDVYPINWARGMLAEL